MGLFATEFGKRRLLSVEVPAIEKYNDGRDAGITTLKCIAKVGWTFVANAPNTAAWAWDAQSPRGMFC